MMQPVRMPWINRAALFCVVTDREDVIESLTGELVHALRVVASNINTELAHHNDSFGPDVARLCSCAKDFKVIPGIMAQETFGHLASSRIASTQN